MQWSELYGDRHEPLDNQIKEFVDTPLWDDLANHLQQTYKVKPIINHKGIPNPVKPEKSENLMRTGSFSQYPFVFA